MEDSLHFTEWFQRGFALQKQGDYRAALACFDLALDVKPDNPQAWWAKASALRQCGPEQFHTDKEEMLRWEALCYEEALRLDPDMTAVRFNLAGIHRELNQYAEAAELLQQIVDAGQASALEPTFTQAQMYVLLAEVYSHIGDYMQALHVARQARQKGIDSDELRGQEERFSKLSSSDPEFPWMKPIVLDYTGGPLSWRLLEIDELRDLCLLEDLEAVADAVRLQHGPTAAVETFRYYEDLARQLNKPNPPIPPIPPEDQTDTTPDILCTWTRDLIAAREFSEARQRLLLLRIIAPEDARTLTLQGYWLSAQGDHEKAALLYDQAVERDPTDAEAWNDYVDCLVRLERWEDARAVCHRAVNSLPAPDRLLLLQQMQLEGLVSPSRALGILFRLEQLFPGRDIELLQAQYMTALGRNEEAQTILQKLDPTWFEGNLAERCRHLQSMHKIVPRAYRLDPQGVLRPDQSSEPVGEEGSGA